jgi:acetoin utilization deacetylase AcuC-like enzyme
VAASRPAAQRGPVVITHPACLGHHPPGHPESPERLHAIERALADPGFAAVRRLRLDATVGEAGPRARAAAGAVHDREHVNAVFDAGTAATQAGDGGWVDADTYIGPGSLEAACAGLLSALEAVRLVLDGETTTAFSFCRPPGHHATRSRAMGFCLFNNVAAAAQAALAAGLSRVAIVDFDVHHGNGTQDIFYDRPDVLYISTHQWPLYPGTGAAEERGSGAGEGFTLNLPLPAGADDRTYARAMEARILPALSEYQPEMLLLSAGYDAHRDDPLAGMELTSAGFGAIAERLLDAADELCGGRSAWVLEGGYDLDALASSAAATVAAAVAHG